MIHTRLRRIIIQRKNCPQSERGTLCNSATIIKELCYFIISLRKKNIKRKSASYYPMRISSKIVIIGNSTFIDYNTIPLRGNLKIRLMNVNTCHNISYDR